MVMKISWFDFTPNRALTYGLIIGLVLGALVRTILLS